MNEKRLELLRKIEKKEISLEEGDRLLADLEAGEGASHEPAAQTLPIVLAAQPGRLEDELPPMPDADPEPPQTPSPASYSPDSDRVRIAYWQRWWLLPFLIGCAITFLGAWWMYLGYRAAGLSWGFWFSWFPFGLGVLVVALSARSRTARWLHVRVKQSPGKHPPVVAISMPLPLSLAAWAMRTFGRWMPNEVRDKHLDEVISAVDAGIRADEPFYVEVDDPNGEHVEVFIG